MKTENLKNLNVAIPTYVTHLKRDKDGFLLCPNCNHRLTYVENSDHIECDVCNKIHGIVNLIQYNEHISFSNALKMAKELAEKPNDNVIRFKDVDKRTIGVRYENAKSDILKIYDSNYNDLPLIFTDMETGSLIYGELLSLYLGQENYKSMIPNIISISASNYVYNAMSVLMRMKKSHHIKIFVVMENRKEITPIKTKLLNDLQKYEFNNVVIPDLIENYDLYKSIKGRYERDKLNFRFFIDNVFKNFNVYKKAFRETKDTEHKELRTETPNGAI